MRRSSLRIARYSIYPCHSSVQRSSFAGSRKMAEQPVQSQDASTGEEIASTTIPLKGSLPKRNACTPTPNPRFPHPLLTCYFSQRSHVSQETSFKENSTPTYAAV